MNDTAVIVTSHQYGASVAVWNPWRELRDRPHLEFGLVALPAEAGGGVYWPELGWSAILVDRRLGRRRRKCALAHELVHDERGGGVPVAGMPHGWAAVAAREERRVEEEVARRLVPIDGLEEWLERCEALEWGVTAAQVAEEFDVSDDVAHVALNLLTNERRPQ